MVGEDQVHADEITTQRFRPLAQPHARVLRARIGGEALDGIGVDDHARHRRYGQQGVEHPGVERAVTEQAEVLARYALAVGLHRQQRNQFVHVSFPGEESSSPSPSVA
jgi:hypothetical protein